MDGLTRAGQRYVQVVDLPMVRRIGDDDVIVFKSLDQQRPGNDPPSFTAAGVT